MSKKKFFVLFVWLILFVAGSFQGATVSENRVLAPSGSDAKAGHLKLSRKLPPGRSTPHLAVVPIVVNAGAALLPTIMAFLANIAAVMFNPRALARFLRRRWRVVSLVAVSIAIVILVGLPLLKPAPSPRAAAGAGTGPADQINWSKVAEELIAQEKLRQALTSAVNSVGGQTDDRTAQEQPRHSNAASGRSRSTLSVPGVDAIPVATAVSSLTTVSSAAGAAVAAAPANPMKSAAAPQTAGPNFAAQSRQDYSRSHSDGGVSPAGLTPLWSFQPEDGLFFGMPAIVGKRIYVAANQTDLGGYTGLLASLDYDTGKPIWQVTELNKEALPPFFSSPAVTPDGKYVVIGQGLHQDRNSSLLCFDAATGALRWAVKTTQHIESSPAIFGDMAIVGAGAIEGADGKPAGDPGFVFAVRISDGKLLWKQAVNDPESSPAIDENGVVYIGSGVNGQAVVAIRSGTDEELKAQQLQRIIWRTPLAYPILAPITISGDLVIVGGGNGDVVHSDKNPQGLVVALNRKTGQIVWQQKLEDAVLGSIAVDHGMMIAPLRSGEVAALAVDDGHLLWRSRVSGSAPVLVGAALTKERAYVVSNDGYLVAFATATGKIIEKIYLNDQKKAGTGLSLSPPQVSGNRIIVGSETGGLRALLGAGSAK